MLTTSYPLEGRDISGVFVKRVVEALAKHVDIKVITPADNEDRAVRTDNLVTFRYAPSRLQLLAHQPGGIPVALKNHRSLYFILPFFMLSMFFSLMRNARKADLIHANWLINGVIAGLAGAILRVPVVTTLRGSDVMKLQSSGLTKFLLKLLLSTNRKVVCVSEAVQRQVIDAVAYDSEMIVTVENGIDPFLVKQSRHEREYVWRLITIGNLIPLKQIDHILRAFADKRISDRAELSVVGDGPQLSGLKALAEELGIDHAVQFTGGVDPSSVAKKLGENDLFLFASRSEGRPNVILEAMAAGLTIIASDIDGVKSLLTDRVSGMLYESGNIEQLKERILTVLDTPELAQSLGKAARTEVINREMTWEATAKCYLKIYRSSVL